MMVTSSISGAGAQRPGKPRLPTRPTGWPVGQYDSYEAAQRTVDFLADNNFPVQEVTIVGVDLMLVERVTGRLSWGRTVSAGAMSGAWFGLFVGLLLGLFSGQGGSLAPIVIGLVAGLFFGLVFSIAGHLSGRGRRDFQSASQLVAGRYDVLCQPHHAELARDLVAKLSMRAARTQPGQI
ncbi:MAG TPA: general stress protein [Pseudonocardiaceae bacterium]|jgi:hypothetical protein|nr:general stress protein [Pseudonocardiaceae bacterium]